MQTTQPQQKNLNKMHVALNARTLLHSVPLLLKRLIGRLLSVQLSWKRKLATVESFKAGVSSVSPSSEGLEELWVVCGLICRKWSYFVPLVGIWWRETGIKSLNEKRSLISWGLRVPVWKMNFRSSLLRLSELHRCKERLQTAICCLECLGEIKKNSKWQLFIQLIYSCFLIFPAIVLLHFLHVKPTLNPKFL